VVRRFNLADILLIRRLRGQEVHLDLETALLWSPAPLWVALTDFLPLDEARSSTFVERDSSTGRPLRGFVQAWDRADRASCDVICIAPSLERSPPITQMWRGLLEHLCLDKGEQGIQRIYAKLPEDEAGIDVFRQVGFGRYTRRHIFRLEQLPPDLSPPEGMLLRPLKKGDAWGLGQLRNSLTPRLVQHAEGGIEGQRDFSGLLPWWKSRRTEEYVLEYGGEIQAYLRIVAGEKGHWLRVLIGPQATGKADRILSEGLLIVSAYPQRPVYFSIREYEAGLQGALGALGFQPCASEVHMVKHTTVRAGVPVSKLSPALEKHVETATPISTSSSFHEAFYES
jgi:hypothetical protein